MLIKGAAVLGEDFIFRRRDIAVEGGVFRAAGCNCGEILDGTGLFLLPGLVDIHTHGAAGCDNMDADPAAIDTITDFLARRGVTTYLATILTQSREAMGDAADLCTARAARRDGGDVLGGGAHRLAALREDGGKTGRHAVACEEVRDGVDGGGVRVHVVTARRAVRVDVHKAGEQEKSRAVEHFAAVAVRRAEHAVLDRDVAAAEDEVLAEHGRTFNQHGVPPPFCRAPPRRSRPRRCAGTRASAGSPH